MQQSKPPEGKSLPMINSFLNLCRVCPVPTEDKVNSEYKRNFTWHDGYQATKVDVVRNAPSMPSAEPSHPSRKQFPPVRDHLMHDEGGEEVLPDVGQLGLADCRARSEERRHFKSRASPRSRSADSTISRRLRAVAIPDEDTRPPPKDDADSKKAEEKQPLMSQSFPPLSTQPRGNPGTPGPPEEGGRVPPHTEYRSQFVAYPHQNSPTTRKSASMGLIAQKDALDGDAPSGEPWSAVPTEDDDDAALDAVKRGRIKKTEYKAKFRPFSAYTYVDGSWKKATRLIKERAADDMDLYSSYSYPLFDGGFIVANSQTCTATLEKSPRTIIITIEIGTSVGPSEMRLIGAQEQQECDGSVDQHAWYSEVVERLKKADQYRTRSHAGMPLYSSEPIEFLARDRTVLSPVSVASSSRTWKDDRPLKERGRPVPVHHRKEKKDAQDSSDHPKSREGSTKKKSHVEKVTVRPKSAEPVIPVKSEHKSPKRSRPRAPRDLPVHGHGDLSGKKKATRQSSPSKPRAVHRPAAAEGKVWLKPDEAKETLVNGFSEDKMVNGEADDSVQHETEQDKVNGEYPVFRAPAKVPLTTVKSPEEVTGVRSPDPESWTVPLEIGKGLHWMDGKTPGSEATGESVDL